MIARIASASIAHRRLVIVGWLLAVIAGFAVVPGLFGNLTSDVAEISSTESVQAHRDLRAAEPKGDEVYAVADGRAASDPGLKASVTKAASDIKAMPGVLAVQTPWNSSSPNPQAVSRDGRAVAIAVQFTADAPDGSGDRVVSRIKAIDAPRVIVGGGFLQDEEMDAQAASDLAKAETISMPIVLVLLVVVMGGILAAGLPVLVAILGMALTLGLLAVASWMTDISVYSINIVTMLGLGLAIDYALLIVSRYREERATNTDPVAAVVATMSNAGRTVTFSGLTVAASLAGLLVFPDPFLRSAGLAGMGVVLLDLALTLTLLPALLAIVGGRIRPAKAVRTDRGFFVRVTHLVAARPVMVIVATVPVLLLAAAPFLGARFAEPDARSLPSSSESRQLSELATSRFGVDADVDPVTVVARGTLPPSYADRLRTLPGVQSVSVRPDVAGLTVIDVVPQGESQGDRAMALVKEIRHLDGPAVRVTGDAAVLTDYQASLKARAPYALGIVVLATFVLLFLFTGSVIVPLKALVLNTLSLGASFGALVWVFQDGHLGGLIDTPALGSLSITTPVLLFAIAFGLSMDYEVFLLGRISETWRRTGSNTEAIAVGLQRTGRVVTAAALLMAVVFAGFVAGGFSPVKQVGLGLLLAVIVDATVVRLLLMPAAMTLMGRWNWWAPAPLRRLHDRVGLTEEPARVDPARTLSPV
ncbi:MMPL family transporter [Luteipulveratus mongoliensis]|uniref:SSD domain-containing protein n=1 Tax=Luteipulveratus mongoliensis TaxID=571913 RepID=A0A0K1JG52_9MICO|nr:MMPL family transporter [Luteipulveratus mongoliensis]AKU15568.1 hypothetical protein VV02_06350 [Luteipulveratus mongoliensis]